LILLFIVSLSACGGGGSDTPPTEGNNSDWDNMVWDQDNWK